LQRVTLKYEHADVVRSTFLGYPAEFRKLSTSFDGMSGIVLERALSSEGREEDSGFPGTSVMEAVVIVGDCISV
jgi:hypothetical protein